MKKLTLFAALLLGALTVNAGDYKHSIGVNVGNQYGVSYKAFLFGNENLALQIDLGVRLQETSGSYNYKTKVSGQTFSTKGKFKQGNMFTFEVNPNMLYQKEFFSYDGGKLSWFAGGGISLGLLGQYGSVRMKDNDESLYWYYGRWITDETGAKTVYGKFGFNAIGGVELKFTKIPLAISCDFRPGYGLGFWAKDVNGAKVNNTFHFFDYEIAVGVRYCI